MTHDKIRKLVALIRASKLKFTNTNLKRVQEAWGQCLVFDDAFKQTGLEWLPDPDGTDQYHKVFEDWMVEAFEPQYGAEETRRKLEIVRDQILKEERGE